MLSTRGWDHDHDHQHQPDADMAFGAALWRRCMGNETPQAFMDFWSQRVGYNLSIARAVELTIRERYHGPNTDMMARLVLRGLIAHLIFTQQQGEWRYHL